MADAKPESGFVKFFRDKDEVVGAPRQRWAGSATFILAAIGSAIGLGNFWRFPYLTYKWGGGIFFIPYLFALFFLGLPMMMLELSLGQLFQRGDIGVFRGIHPRLYGVGLASVFSAFAINIFYTYLIAIALCYFFASIFVSPAPWSVQRTEAYQDVYCNAEGMYKATPEIACPRKQVCKSSDFYITEEWFLMDLLNTLVDEGGAKGCTVYDTKTNIGGSADQTTSFSWQLMLALLFTWMVTYFCVFKGVKSSSYVVWFTVPGPIIFIFIMVMNGLCLPNADEGIRMYLKGEIDGQAVDAAKKLGNGQMWADAVGQIFFSLGVCMGVMTSYASYNRKNKPIIRDVFVISFGNCLLSFFAGFAVFSIVGYLKWIGSPVSGRTSSTGLAFIAYPAAAETLPASNFWVMILGLTLFMLGIDTAFSLVEAVSTVIYDTEGGKMLPRKLTALIVCVLGWLGSLLFCSSWGFTYFDVVDRYISVYLMFILGIGQCAAAAWFFQARDVFKGEGRNSAMVITIVYWVGTLIMGPVTIFAMENKGDGTDKGRMNLQGFGILIFWVFMIIAWIVSFLIKPAGMSPSDWCKKICFYGAYDLALKVAKKHDENSSDGQHQWWFNIFIGWWGFSIKYFIPWCLWSLMMWNFKADITANEDGIVGYGQYHIFWQIMGFVFPAIGLACFFIPMCICGESTADADLAKAMDDEIWWEKEEHPDLQAQQDKKVEAIKLTRDAEKAAAKQ